MRKTSVNKRFSHVDDANPDVDDRASILIDTIFEMSSKKLKRLSGHNANSGGEAQGPCKRIPTKK